MWIGKVWYLCYFAGLVCIWPYINIFFHANGLNDAQIGILAALRPWVSAPASFLWSAAADRFAAHQTVLLVTIVVSTLLRACMAAAHTFPAFLVLAAVSEFVAAPTGVIADAAVVASCKQATDYGKTRLWGAVGWGGVSTLSGWAVARFGVGVGFAGYVVLTAPCALVAWQLAAALTHKQQQQQQEQQPGRLGAANNQPQTRSMKTKDSAVELADISNCAGSPVRVSRLSAREQIRQLAASEGQRLLLPDQATSHQQGLQQGRALATDMEAQCDTGADSSMAPQHDQHSRSKKLPVAPAEQAASPAPQQQPGKHLGQQDADSLLDVESGQDSRSSPAVALQDPPQPNSPLLQQLCNDANDLGAPQPSVEFSQTLLQRDREPVQQQLQEQKPSPNVAGLPFAVKLALLLHDPAVLLFMWQATLMGFGIGTIGEFLFLYLEQLGGSTTLMGLTLTVTCAAEVPAFHYQGRVLQVISEATMLHVVLWTYMVRMLLYALLPLAGTPWAVLPVELLHGITFACGWGAGTILCQRLAPAGLEATMQGIFQGLYFGVGQGLGGLMGGLLMERYGGQAMFCYCAAIVFGGWALGLVAGRLHTLLHGQQAHTHSSQVGNAGIACLARRCTSWWCQQVQQLKAWRVHGCAARSRTAAYHLVAPGAADAQPCV